MSSASQPRGQTACETCRKMKTRCSLLYRTTEKCERCQRLRRECVAKATGQSKSPKSGRVSSPAPAHEPPATSSSASEIASEQDDALHRCQSPNLHPSALCLVPILPDIVAVGLHDLELDKGIEWANHFFQGVFDVEAFRTHLNEAAQGLGTSHPCLVRLCHWALVLRQPCVRRILEVTSIAEEFMSKIFGAWFDEVKKPTLWTLMATIILLDGFRTMGDIRYNILEVLAHEMVDDPSRFESSESQGHRIEELSSILRSQFPRANSTQGLSVTKQGNSEDRGPMLRHPTDVFRPPMQRDDSDTTSPVRPNRLRDPTSDAPGPDSSNYFPPPSNLSFSFGGDVANIFRCIPSMNQDSALNNGSIVQGQAASQCVIGSTNLRYGYGNSTERRATL
ncbi:uncharacterized protein EI90DRAFT_3031269 [Cantharellus anzutake]|uniref:uncharacterized protein n=1 Tax=Cantharellus anzutake TaxID=1750568 RepID=UPI0019085CF2|nr:uncharacterized protein EI90DRAFT_3031269 [Cantharellus anzutake]KAF8343068.1 hypothetical protein EI90DRAFT_3031269 [Cantharellus anzutake]